MKQDFQNAAVLQDVSAVYRPNTSYPVLGAISVSHLLNDMLQSLLLAIYPMLKHGLHLSFAQIGLITLTYQLTGSLLQPLVGWFTDKRPQPYALPVGMAFTLAGLLLLSVAQRYELVLIASSIIGMGSSIFHPESSRVARMASGGQHGLAQSLFQVGGNAGTALGPLLAAMIVVPQGQGSVAWFALAALLAIVVLWQVSRWRQTQVRQQKTVQHASCGTSLSRRRVGVALLVLLALMFSKFFYMTSIWSYFTFYLIDRFHLTLQQAQFHLFVFLFAVAAGTILGGPIGDWVGRKLVIWISILGVAPFTLLLPYANLFWTGVLSAIIGLILASAFATIVVYAQELLPGKVGTIAGLFFGLAFGLGGVGAALLGRLADATSIEFVYRCCAFLPLLGLLAVFLPKLETAKP